MPSVPRSPVVADGQVADVHERPLAHAEVLLRDSTNAIVSHTYSDTNGLFRVRGLQRGTPYRFIVRKLGFTPDTMQLTTAAIGDTSHQNDTLYLYFMMHERDVMLAGVKVTAKKKSGLFASIVNVYNKIDHALDKIDQTLTKIDNTLNKYCTPEATFVFCVGREPPPHVHRPKPQPPDEKPAVPKTPTDSQPAGRGTPSVPPADVDSTNAEPGDEPDEIPTIRAEPAEEVWKTIPVARPMRGG